MGFVKDFKAFISRGNVVDMAVGVVVGGAFGKIVSSLVADIITPLTQWKARPSPMQLTRQLQPHTMQDMQQ